MKEESVTIGGLARRTGLPVKTPSPSGTSDDWRFVAEPINRV